MEVFLICSALILSLPFLNSAPETTVILLDNNSTHNAIDITTKAGKVSIDQPYYLTTLSSPDKAPSRIEQINKDTVLEKYADVLDFLPRKPISLMFHFEQGTSEITQSSKEQVDELIKIVFANEPASLDIIGHSDRAGDADENYKLALERAREVERFLREAHVNMERIHVASYGENDPLVQTDDGVSEPQNRRVEVIVR